MDNKKYTIIPCNSYCTLDKFTIKGKKANYHDFGSKYDTFPEEELQYCGNMKFIAYKPNKEVLDKYDINEEEYNEIVNELKEVLSFGKCGLCI